MRIPVSYTPRFYQLPFLKAMDEGIKRAVCIWHRRSGKSKTMLNFACKKAHERIGTYFHCLPEYGQARKTIWDAIDKDTGQRYIDLHIPLELRERTNNTEMKIQLKIGSVYQLIGADNFNSVVGSNPVGLILDEYAVSERYEQAWNYFRPILVENGGWAVFPFTPRGRNHGWDVYQTATKNPKWFSQLLTVEDTKSISRFEIEEEREAGMPESMIQQEFYCSFLSSTGDIVIPFELIQGALRRDVQYAMSGRVAGMDVARYGDDKTSIVIRQGGQIIHADFWSGNDLVQSAGKAVSLFDSKMYDCIAIDTIGLGAGVYDMIKNNSRNIPCVPVNVSESPTDSRFRKLRDELWWRAREWFEDKNCSIEGSIPSEAKNLLLGDIQDIKYKYSPTGQIVIESKDDMKERLGFSPDLGDALCCTFAPGIESKISQVEKSVFGGVPGIVTKNDYNPLTFGLGI